MLPIMRRAEAVLGQGGLCTVIRDTVSSLAAKDDDTFCVAKDSDCPRRNRTAGGVFLRHLRAHQLGPLILAKKKKRAKSLKRDLELARAEALQNRIVEESLPGSSSTGEQPSASRACGKMRFVRRWDGDLDGDGESPEPEPSRDGRRPPRGGAERPVRLRAARLSPQPRPHPSLRRHGALSSSSQIYRIEGFILDAEFVSDRR